MFDLILAPGVLKLDDRNGYIGHIKYHISIVYSSWTLFTKLTITPFNKGLVRAIVLYCTGIPQKQTSLGIVEVICLWECQETQEFMAELLFLSGLYRCP